LNRIIQQMLYDGAEASEPDRLGTDPRITRLIATAEMAYSFDLTAFPPNPPNLDGRPAWIAD
jgi:hypothetical protein